MQQSSGHNLRLAALQRRRHPRLQRTAEPAVHGVARGPGNDLITLCACHHLRAVRGGVLRCTGVAPDGLRFELGLLPDGTALAGHRSGDVCDAGGTAAD